MFGRGTEELLARLPVLNGLSDPAVRRLLSRAWLEVAERRELAAPNAGDDITTEHDLRRLAAALQVHTVLASDLLEPATHRACAFVAAEALDIAREFGRESNADIEANVLERLVVGLLYLMAGFDANAKVAVRDVVAPPDASAAAVYGLDCLLAFLKDSPNPNPPPAGPPENLLHERVRSALWRRIGDCTADFARWLRDPELPATDASEQLLELADLLRLSDDDIPVPVDPDLHHIARLSSRTFDEVQQRAVRSVPQPEAESQTFARFLASRCSRQPLLWPAAAEYADAALPGPSKGAVVAVPTGAGKSGVADLAIQHAVTRGWALYLAPTNALVGQVQRQLRQDHPGLTIRGFLGGAEYTTLPGDAIEQAQSGEILVMTPEKCSLALRQSPEIFAELALLIFDEAHLLGDWRGRGVLSELVLAETLERAPEAVVLLMSALIANPADLADWLAGAQEGREVIVVREPWRPTRTLRAVVGIDRPATLAAAQEPGRQLDALPPRRRNVGFEAPLAVLAGLQGPWSSRGAEDYAIVKIGTTTPMRVTRPRGGGVVVVDPASAAVRPTVEALAQLLGERDQKVMAFLPRSKHDSFSAALSIPGFGQARMPASVDALLGLAEAELGVESALANALAKGVGVHTSALLAEERRASEIAFDEGEATVLFATGTLAQGLNLPATAVIIGGTDIGYDPDQSADERRSQQRSQLLNAIGRAGRARVAARSLALIVPSRLPDLDADTLVEVVLPRAEFLAEEDGSTRISSALRPLLARMQDETDIVNLDDLRGSDHFAVSYFSAEEDTIAPSVLRRTWAAHQIAAVHETEELAAALVQLGRQAIEATGGPAWARDAARRAGVPLPVAASFCELATDRVSGPDMANVDAWLQVMIDAIAALPPRALGLLLPRDAFRSTALESLWSEAPADKEVALEALRRTLNLWLAGETFATVGGAAHGTDRIESGRRGQTDPIPRTIRLVETGLRFGLTRAAGLLVAAFDVAVDAEAIDPPEADTRTALERLPIAIRFGAADPVVLALSRAGARPRVVAHLLATHLDRPDEQLDDDGLLDWAKTQLSRLGDSLEETSVTPQERQLLARFMIARDAQ